MGSGAFLTLFGIILGIVRCCVLPYAVRRHRQHHHHHQKDELENGKPRSSLDAITLNEHQQEMHNKSSTTVSTTGTAKSFATPRSSVTSSTIPPRHSNATVLSPTEHEALINNASNANTNVTTDT